MTLPRPILPVLHELEHAYDAAVSVRYNARGMSPEAATYLAVALDCLSAARRALEFEAGCLAQDERAQMRVS